ncbi:flagellin N-terminal helical domain-containing protein [Photobacterium damselae]|uniref:flagellin N-terminal helical domain-containing protein n=1 Tax=Photobacterium damselae TaxID=38293 RepID=UPI00406762AD
MLTITTNLPALTAQIANAGAQEGIQKASERLTTGLRINHSSDDVSGAALANRLNTSVLKTQAFEANAADGKNMIQAADNSVKQQQALLSRMQNLAFKAENGTKTSADRGLIQKEFDQLAKELLRNESNQEFNGKKLLDGNLSAAINVGLGSDNQIEVKIQNKAMLTGAKIADFTKVDLSKTTIDGVAVAGGAAGSIKDAAGAAKSLNDAIAKALDTAQTTLKTKPTDAAALKAVAALDGAVASVNADGNLVIQTPKSVAVAGLATAGIADATSVTPRSELIGNDGVVKISLDGHADGDAWKKDVHDKLAALASSYNNQRAELGSEENRLSFTIKNLQGNEENLTKTLSQIQDTDFAKETSELSKDKVLAKTSQAVLSQSNKRSEEIAQLLQ